MAEGLLRSMAGDKFDVFSAGAIVTYVNPYAKEAMAEICINITEHKSEHVDEYADQAFDYVFTLCDNGPDDICPIFEGDADKQIHHPFYDPIKTKGTEEEVLIAFRTVRDEIKLWLNEIFSIDCPAAS